MAGAYGVFSVQPSSGRGVGAITDTDEIHFGINVADLALAAGVEHLVHTSSNAAGARTGVGHFDSKSLVEAHIRALAIAATNVRPSTFMEILLVVDFGLPVARCPFFMAPYQSMQFIAVKDIGRIVAAIFAEPETFRGRTLELAGDSLSGNELAPISAGRSAEPLIGVFRAPRSMRIPCCAG